MLPWIFCGIGLVLLVVAGDLLVRGASGLSLRLGVPALLVSLTVVAFGTSAPELIVSLSAVSKGQAALALGNVVGSNIANILLVLGIPAILAALHTSGHDTKKSYLVMLGATALTIALGLRGVFDRWAGLIMLAVLALILIDQAREALAHRREGKAAADPELEELAADESLPVWKILTMLVLGLVGLPVGANLLVNGASDIARDFGISEAVIGLTLVAVGTSLPELATTVMAALRRQADVALGNVIGSNMFNLLAILGITSLFGKITVDPSFVHFDFWVMAASSLLLVPFVLMKKDISRLWGAGLTGLYVLYVGSILT
ncbi:calcium/sodium antiporter [Pseudooceanicola sp. CBS1P-1]|uniref:Calcium/sodium antiporter n=1 Tax=Pseudooceanicola albus TaxID=2692189 RepID=A0A6L7G434_9RHOB|nr:MULTISPECIES: calcium/sodium antiporter [Pseudooceanicola]MBT9384876.1 calcium/sodium antiporter [Pseudooceanicola endophyticus]MXN18130.1 calcium/sodium antiporter [Pseudooceanicola albus]